VSKAALASHPRHPGRHAAQSAAWQIRDRCGVGAEASGALDPDNGPGSALHRFALRRARDDEEGVRFPVLSDGTPVDAGRKNDRLAR
jgi:hypothetical protein